MLICKQHRIGCGSKFNGAESYCLMSWRSSKPWMKLNRTKPTVRLCLCVCTCVLPEHACDLSASCCHWRLTTKNSFFIKQCRWVNLYFFLSLQKSTIIGKNSRIFMEILSKFAWPNHFESIPINIFRGRNKLLGKKWKWIEPKLICLKLEILLCVEIQVSKWIQMMNYHGKYANADSFSIFNFIIHGAFSITCLLNVFIIQIYSFIACCC